MREVRVDPDGKEPFSAEIYLRNATGPLAPYFREMLPDVDGLATARPGRAQGGMDRTTSSGSPTTSASRRSSGDKAQKLLDESRALGRRLVQRPRERREAEQVPPRPGPGRGDRAATRSALSFQSERAWEARRGLDADRRALIAPLVERGKALRDAVAKLATARQARLRAHRPASARRGHQAPSRQPGPGST